MRYWSGPIAGVVFACIYAGYTLSDDIATGGEHFRRASGDILAWALAGLFVGTLISAILWLIDAAKNGLSNSNARMPLCTVFVWDTPLKIQVEGAAGLWIAQSEYRGKRIVAQEADPAAAITAWIVMARAKDRNET